MPNLWRSSGQPEQESAPHRTASKVYLYIEKMYLGTNMGKIEEKTRLQIEIGTISQPPKASIYHREKKD
jgi:hypothetical protein